MLHSGPAGSMLVSGEDRWSGYLPERFFGSGPRQRRHLGDYWTWQLPRAVERWRDEADITIARADRTSTALFPASEYLRVPEWVRMVAPVPASNDDLRSSSARSDMRVVRRNRLTWRVSHDARDFLTYVERDYYPYTRLRYGDEAFVQPLRVMRDTFRRGGLLWVERAGEPVAGLIFDTPGHAFRHLTIACVGANDALLRAGAVAAVYLFSFECARSLGLTSVDMRGIRPCLHDPLFAVKQKFGGAVTLKPDNVYELLVRWREATPAVERFLGRSPLVFRDGTGLSAIHADRVTPRRRLAVAGLRRLLTVAPRAPFGSWQEDRGDDPATDR